MGEVGMKMDVSLRETSMGGVATSPKGLEIAYRLLAEADVFVTNTRTKSLKKLGLDYDTLNEKFPKLIFAQVLGYGEYGESRKCQPCLYDGMGSYILLQRLHPLFSA